MNETYLPANGFGAVVCAAFLVVGLTPAFFQTIIACSEMTGVWWRQVFGWLCKTKSPNEKTPDNS